MQKFWFREGKKLENVTLVLWYWYTEHIWNVWAMSYNFFPSRWRKEQMGLEIVIDSYTSKILLVG